MSPNKGTCRRSHFGIVCVRHPHNNGLQCDTFVVYILSSTSHDGIVATPELQCPLIRKPADDPISELYVSDTPIITGYNVTHSLYIYCHQLAMTVLLLHPSCNVP